MPATWTGLEPLKAWPPLEGSCPFPAVTSDLKTWPQRPPAESLHFPNPASLGFILWAFLFRTKCPCGCLEKAIERCRHGAWRAAWGMLAFLCFGVNSGIWRPAVFPLNKTACCQANLLLGGFSIARPTAVAALEEP